VLATIQRSISQADLRRLTQRQLLRLRHRRASSRMLAAYQAAFALGPHFVD
jgi:hypothetical protein